MKLDFGASAIDDDGDGIIKICLSGINTPDSAFRGRWPAQPKSQEAKELAENIALGQPATARLKGDKTYGRFVGEVFVLGTSLNRELVRAGLAWWNRKFEEYDRDYQRLEELAKQNKIGIWEEEDPTPPWEWRR